MPDPDAYNAAIVAFERRADEFEDPRRRIERFRTAMARLRTPSLTALQGARDDLIRRMVAVAISVGFATFLAKMNWLHEGLFPTSLEWEQLSRLVVALLVILLGWDWYHRDIDRHPDTSLLRFLVDVSVVVASLIFLISSTHERVWLLFLVVIFVLYLLWDVVTYSRRFMDFCTPYQNIPQRVRALWREEARRKKIRGPITNVSWLVYFFGMYCLDNLCPSPALVRALVPCAFVAAGAGLLWLDGNHLRQNNNAHGWTWPVRVCTIVSLWIVFILCLVVACMVPAPPVLQVTEAEISDSRMVVAGRSNQPNATILLGKDRVVSDDRGDFRFETKDVPSTCMVTVSNGDRTDTAAVSNCGLPGAKGEAGPAGPTGPGGPRGEAGPAGPMGPDGTRGEIGPPGPMGLDGTRGEMGLAGRRGLAGQRGDVGPRGPPGKLGRSGAAWRFPIFR